MGLDAFVFCDCYEKGRLKRPPPKPKLISLLPNGGVGCRSEDPEELDLFDAWRAKACRHDQGMVAGEYLGNSGFIGELAVELAGRPKLFPVLLKDVLYCGSHTGDHLTLRKVKKLEAELERLESFHSGKKGLDRDLQSLRRKLQRLVHASLRLGKPIAF